MKIILCQEVRLEPTLSRENDVVFKELKVFFFFFISTIRYTQNKIKEQRKKQKISFLNMAEKKSGNRMGRECS